MTRIPRITRLLALLLALALLGAACGDDDDTGTAGDDGTEEPTEEPADDGGDGSDGAAATTGVLEFVPLDVGGPITKQALADGDIDVAVLFTTDADIAVNDWVLLEDDRNLQEVENLIPAIRTDVLTAEIEAVLDAVSAPLTTEGLTELNRQYSQDLVPADEIAASWLSDQGLVPWEGDPVDASLTVGSTNFPEQEIVAELYAQTLESAGADISRQFQMGAREVVAPALESGEIDLYPEYIASYTRFLDPEATVSSDPSEGAMQLRSLLEGTGVTVLEPAPAQDRNGLVVTAETADTYGLSTTSDLADVEDVLVLGGPPECPERQFCAIGLEEVYGLTFR